MTHRPPPSLAQLDPAIQTYSFHDWMAGSSRGRMARVTTTKSAFPTLGAPMLPAWVHGSPHVEDLACNFTLAKAVILVDVG
jgi:hypothetical protein